MSGQRNRGGGEGGRNRRIAGIAAVQGGVVSLDQLRSTGLSRQATAYRAGVGRLHRVHRGVYAVGHPALERLGELRAALLACGSGSVISHGTAAAFWGLWDRWPHLIDVTVRCQAGRKLDGIRCRRCRFPAEEEIVLRRGVACTTPPRTLVDLAGVLGTSSLRRAVGRAAVLGLLDLDALYPALHNAAGRRGLPLLRSIASDWDRGDGQVADVRSDFEALVFPRLVALGLPRPACNVKLRIDGDELIVDFLWAKQRLVVETDGQATHGTPIAFQHDRWRDQVLVSAGYRVARATWDQIHRELDSVVARISRALSQASD